MKTKYVANDVNGWVEMPERYSPGEILMEDVEQDSQLRLVSSNEARSQKARSQNDKNGKRAADRLKCTEELAAEERRALGAEATIKTSESEIASSKKRLASAKTDKKRAERKVKQLKTKLRRLA